ncbi:serine protein kinase RIO [Candidatus Micrarchaeota archaeon]|nr:serine protein kinase RIO [Candidatus Micrarchaeota archaeon]
MARKVSKKKKPSKDDYLLKEREKLEDLVFDKYTLKTLARLLAKNIITKIDCPISTGKEANVYRATKPDGKFVAIKIYRIETTRFFRKICYIEGDPRFVKIKKDRKNLAFAFTKKEFKNLTLCRKYKLNTPKPIFFERNVLVMEFLGEKGIPYPPMYKIDVPGSFLDIILKQVKKMYSHGLVHSDLSAYNILAGKKPYLIDFAQGVVSEHPRFEQFLERDVGNVLHFFRKDDEKEKVLKWIREK